MATAPPPAPTSGQRAFAGLRSRVNASELRSQMTQAMTTSLGADRLKISAPTSVADQTTGSSDNIDRNSAVYLCLYDVVEPTDFEETVAQFRGTTSAYDGGSTTSPRTRIQDFPPDDIEVRSVARDPPTIDPPFAVDFDWSRIEPKVRDVVGAYNNDLCIVHRKYDQHTTGSVHESMCFERPILAQTLPRQIYDVDETSDSERVHDDTLTDSNQTSQRASYASTDSTASMSGLEQSESDPVLQGVTARSTAGQLDVANDTHRQQQRCANVMQLMPLQAPSDVVEHVTQAPFPSEPSGAKILARVLSFKLSDVDPFEPVFLSMALFDIRAGRRLSENFYFDCNSEQIKLMLANHTPHQDESTMCKAALFNVTHPTQDMYIIIRLEKVLQAMDVSDAIEPYVRDDRSLNREKLLSSAFEYCDRLGAYRMPLAWCALELTRVFTGTQSGSFDLGATTPVGAPQPPPSQHLTTSSSFAAVGALGLPPHPTPTKSIQSAAPGIGYGTDSESIVSADRESHISNTSFVRVGSGASRQTTMTTTTTGVRVRAGSLGHHKLSTASLPVTQSTNATTPTVEEAASNLRFQMANFQTTTITLTNFYKMDSDRLSDADLFKLLTDNRKANQLSKRLKCISGTLMLEFSPVSDDLPNRLSPHLLRMQPWHSTRASDGLDLTKELVEFPIKEVYAPNVSYRNLLYIYPKSVNFSSKPGSARNIAIKVEVLKGDGDIEGLPVIAEHSSCPQWHTYAYTNVCYHNRSPQFADEIKVVLPADLTDSHHLLFTFYHISCKLKTDVRETNVPIGFSWIPLYQDARLKTGDFELPVSLDKLPESYFYLSPQVNLPNVRWLDNHRSVFNVSIVASSTVHTEDTHLDQFLNCYQLIRTRHRTVDETQVQASIRNLSKARPEPLVKFLYIVLDKLLDIIVSQTTTVHGKQLDLASVCFETLAQLVKILNLLTDLCDSNGRSSLLSTYIQYHRVTPAAQNDMTKVLQPTTTIIEPQQQQQQRLASSTSSQAVTSMGTTATGAGRNPKLSTRSTSNPEGVLMDSTTPLDATVAQQQQHAESQLLDIIKGFEKTAMHSSVIGGDTSTDSFTGSTMPKLLHEELASQWCTCTTQAREMAFQNAWFLLELILKSMTEYVSSTNRLYLPRKLRFSESFIEDIQTLVGALTGELIARVGKETQRVKQVNRSLALFVRDCLSVMERSFVLTQLVKVYCRLITAKMVAMNEIAGPLMSLKLDFVRIICSHEHYLTLNLPFLVGQPGGAVGLPQSSSPSPSVSSRSSAVSMGTTIGSSHSSTIGAAELTSEFRSKHFLVGLLLSDLAAVLDSSNVSLQRKAILAVRNLLTSHDADTRITDAQYRSKVAQLYLPLVGIVLDACAQLYDPYSNVNAGRRLVDDCGRKSPDVMQAISVFAPRVGAANDCTRNTLTFDSTRQLLASFAWVLKNMDTNTLRQWLRELSAGRMTQLVDVLQLCVSCFEYRPLAAARGLANQHSGSSLIGASDSVALSRQHQMLSDVILGCDNANEFLRTRVARHSPRVGERQSLRWRLENYRRSKTTGSTDALVDNAECDPVTEANLCTEISLIVLDTLEILVKVIQQVGMDNLLPLINRVLLHQLSCNGSQVLLENVFASQRALVCKFPELFFENETEQCAELCVQLLRLGAGRLPQLRSCAAASLYLLMRQSFECSGNFARVKMQITVALSTLVSTGAAGVNASALGTRQTRTFSEDALRRTLKTVLLYTDEDVHKDSMLRETSFGDQVKDLVFNLHMILSDTVKMKELQNDFEMLMDLMYRIAKGYETSPDLRVTWLLNMAHKHEERGNHLEAAHCYMHAVAVVCEYMYMMEHITYIPDGAHVFAERLSENVLEESAVSDDVVSPDQEGICESKHFTEEGVLRLLQSMADNFYLAQCYESMCDTYNLVLPMLEEYRDYKRIAHVHQRMADALEKVEGANIQQSLLNRDIHAQTLITADKRVFGTYFRIGFYGARFGDLDGAEFVYKEPPITKLAEISHRLETFYSDRFGRGNIEVIKDSNVVNRARLNSDKAYLQITYVEPYFETWDLRRRRTHYERSHNISRFIFATPFTSDGRAHGDLCVQHKRKTILTTEMALPYVKTRVRVVSKEQTVLSPIEVAIEDVQKKTRELAAATAQEPADAKMLQMVLQGCIGTTVNRGPIEVANVFLGEATELTNEQHRLRLAFKDFSTKCSDALRKNKKLIGADQKAYHDEMERNYLDFTSKLTPMVSVAGLMTARLRSRHSHGASPRPQVGSSMSTSLGEERTAM